MMYDQLTTFGNWFISQNFQTLRPPYHGIRHYTDKDCSLVSVVLFRQPPFQVEMFTVLPREGGSIVSEHGHPNVDSYELYLSGEIKFTLEGKRVYSDEQVKLISPDGAASLCGGTIRVKPNVYHGGIFGPDGGSFLSIQHWLKGDPTSVGLDWEGEPHQEVK